MNDHIVIGYQYIDPPFSGGVSNTDVRLVLDSESLEDYCRLVSASIAHQLTGDPSTLSDLEGKFVHFVPAWGFDGWDLYEDCRPPSVDMVEAWGYNVGMRDPGDDPEDFQWLATPMSYSYSMRPLSCGMPDVDDFGEWWGNSIIPEFAHSFMTVLQGKYPILPSSCCWDESLIGFSASIDAYNGPNEYVMIKEACRFDRSMIGDVAPTPEQVAGAIHQAGIEIVTRKKIWELVDALEEFKPAGSVCDQLAVNSPDPLKGANVNFYQGMFTQEFEGFTGDRGFFDQ